LESSVRAVSKEELERVEASDSGSELASEGETGTRGSVSPWFAGGVEVCKAVQRRRRPKDGRRECALGFVAGTTDFCWESTLTAVCGEWVVMMRERRRKKRRVDDGLGRVVGMGVGLVTVWFGVDVGGGSVMVVVMMTGAAMLW
jgi:hypothetical protein